MKTQNGIPVLKNIDEIADFIASFWISMLEIGRFEMPFKGDSNITNLANMIRFTEVAEDKKIFSDNQIEEIKKRTKWIVERQLIKGYSLSTGTTFTSPGGYLEEMFKGMGVPDGRFPFDMFFGTFSNCYKYMENETNIERYPKEKLAKVRFDFPDGSLLCKRQSGDYWEIIASIQPPNETETH